MTHHEIAMAQLDVARKYLEWRISALEAPLAALQQQGDEERAQELLDQSWMLKSRMQSVEDVVTVLEVIQEMGVCDVY
ncbi:hypothetical protein BAR24_01010 [Gluconobacter oxydans]|uniref:hypothetical protein n=1 Tax=Gluconobacter thailandicus TaxID=257438 RepID=UPI00029974D5|nr:hypothetical protein [Gluconobacter thailandicus]AFW01221.1 hypothetical protein B932_1643 [Gluconobacter oxydans H24]ANQ40160.1 hypothetical protein BAR24_01010 [Gluconobacter oxydans]